MTVLIIVSLAGCTMGTDGTKLNTSGTAATDATEAPKVDIAKYSKDFKGMQEYLIELKLISKKEGDKKTPAGIYAMGFAFGLDSDPTDNYTYRSITDDSYWVDDPDSAHYNRWVEGTEDKDWDSAEALGRIRTEYALAVLIEYNYGSRTVPGKGSAIFLHVDDGTTAGCIAIPKSDLKSLLKWLDKDKDPHIIISNV